MQKKSKRLQVEKTWEVARKIRGDWGNISPVTKVIPNKKKSPKIKHKGTQYDEGN